MTLFQSVWRKAARVLGTPAETTAQQDIAGSVRRIETILAGIQAASAGQARAEMMQIAEQLRGEIRAVGNSVVPGNVDQISDAVISRIEQARPWMGNLFVPRLGMAAAGARPVMAYSTCSAADCESEEFVRTCHELARSPQYHRKIWEWVFIVHHLRRLGMAAAGTRGLGFGVGTETMPSLFARDGAHVVATDAPSEISLAAGWEKTNEFASVIEDIREPSIIDAESFAQRVRFAVCDMNAIGDAFTDFDFCWSSCCLEHLGSLEAGIEFIVNSIEKTLKIGGVACHTTELNLSSDEDTISEGATVLYRKRDIERLIALLRERGHEVDDLRIAPDTHPLDFFVDAPPYTQNPHLKLRLFGYTTTSVGIVARRGR